MADAHAAARSTPGIGLGALLAGLWLGLVVALSAGMAGPAGAEAATSDGGIEAAKKATRTRAGHRRTGRSALRSSGVARPARGRRAVRSSSWRPRRSSAPRRAVSRQRSAGPQGGWPSALGRVPQG